MNTKLTRRIARVAQLPTVLLTLALSAGFASVGYAGEIPTMIITAERPSECASILNPRQAELGHEIRTSADLAIWRTRISVATDLGVKLNSQQRALQLAGGYTDKRG